MGTRSDEITSSIRQRILTGDLPAGSRIVVDDLRATYNSSHIPIREAMRRLQAEGLLVHVANHGTHVAPLSLEEADGLYDARLIIEPSLARRALQNKTSEDVRAVKKAHRALTSISLHANAMKAQHAHTEFHTALLLPGATPTLRRIMEPIWNSVERYLLFIYANPEVATVGHAHHDELYHRWLSGDEDAFVHVLIAHLDSARVELNDTLFPAQSDRSPAS